MEYIVEHVAQDQSNPSMWRIHTKEWDVFYVFTERDQFYLCRGKEGFSLPSPRSDGWLNIKFVKSLDKLPAEGDVLEIP